MCRGNALLVTQLNAHAKCNLPDTARNTLAEQVAYWQVYSLHLKDSDP